MFQVTKKPITPARPASIGNNKIVTSRKISKRNSVQNNKTNKSHPKPQIDSNGQNTLLNKNSTHQVFQYDTHSQANNTNSIGRGDRIGSGITGGGKPMGKEANKDIANDMAQEASKEILLSNNSQKSFSVTQQQMQQKHKSISQDRPRDKQI